MLPQVLQDFVRLIGLAPTLVIVEQYGGCRLYVPVRPTEDHPLAQLIGFENLCTLSRVYGLESHFDIPKATLATRHLRNEKIRADYASKSVRDLAREHRLTERMIWKILSGNKASISRQPALV